MPQCSVGGGKPPRRPCAAQASVLAPAFPAAATLHHQHARGKREGEPAAHMAVTFPSDRERIAPKTRCPDSPPAGGGGGDRFRGSEAARANLLVANQAPRTAPSFRPAVLQTLE